MSDHISYQGLHLGKICLADNNTRKFVFVADDFERLKLLFGRSETDQIDIEGRNSMSYDDFERQVLRTLSGFYSSEEEYRLRNMTEKSLDDL